MCSIWNQEQWKELGPGRGYEVTEYTNVETGETKLLVVYPRQSVRIVDSKDGLVEIPFNPPVFSDLEWYGSYGEEFAKYRSTAIALARTRLTDQGFSPTVESLPAVDTLLISKREAVEA